ncbi:hypothetical protein C8Q77DRAFT_1141396 [Trametes polyzona]|nr:hypothetical protein C8Q77DRAFT_1141396 [Trametes polyzona]
MSSSRGFDIWGAVAGVLGVLVALIPPFAFWVHVRLPSKKLPALVALLHETEGLFDDLRRRRLITDPKEIIQLDARVSTASALVHDFCAVVHSSNWYIHDVQNWWDGVSGRIISVHDALNDIRVKLSKRASLEQKARISREYGIEVTLCSNKDPTIPSILRPVIPPHNVLPLPPSPVPCDTTLQGAFTANHPAYEPVVTSAVSADPAGFVDSATPDPPLLAPPSSRPTHHVVSDADLHSLVSLALSHPLLVTEGGERQRRVREQSLRSLGKQLLGPRYTPAFGLRAAQSPADRESYFKALARLVRRVYGVRSPAFDGDEGTVEMDRESCLP